MSSSEKDTETPGAPVRILIVDDDAITRRLLMVALGNSGEYSVTSASGCNEALEILDREPPFDLIVTDITMPDNSGIFLVSQIRLSGSRVPILVLSAMQAEQHVPAAFAAGADDYLQKPADLKVLREAIASLLANARCGEKAPLAESMVREMGDGSFVELTAVNDASQADRFERFVTRVLPPTVTAEDRDGIRLALEEIVQNAMEWGNRNDPTKQLRLSYYLMPDRITFRIEDQGAGFNPAQLEDPSKDPQKHIVKRMASGKRMGGWGVFMTRKVVDAVSYNPRGNVAFLTKFFSHARPPSGTSSKLDTPITPD
jgi:CheY-like chemotaxis protein/anti-sigma regulatory factor (Ser/Thr protein kinase)